MASGTTLIAVQFLLQHTFGFRQMGVTQAVLWNLLLFVPATMLVNMAIFCLQRRGVVSFYSYGISNDAVRVEESENIDSEEGTVDSRKGTENSERAVLTTRFLRWATTSAGTSPRPWSGGRRAAPTASTT